MSRWRREASERLPELQRIVASRLVDSPMMLWIELKLEFGRLCEQPDPPIDLLSRIWDYCDWCLIHGGDDVRTGAALAFCEHLIDTEAQRAVLPKIMRRSDLLAIRNFLEYHNPPMAVDAFLKEPWK